MNNCFVSLQWRHNGRNGVSNHQSRDCLLNRLFRRRSKKTSKLRVAGLCAGNSPVTGEFPAQIASSAENVSIWWRHHVNCVTGKLGRPGSCPCCYDIYEGSGSHHPFIRIWPRCPSSSYYSSRERYAGRYVEPFQRVPNDAKCISTRMYSVVYGMILVRDFNSSPLGQNGRHSTEAMFKGIFLN